MKQQQRVFSGVQPSGDIHIGNYLGAIRKWVELTTTHDCIYCVVDDHAITVDYDVTELPRRTFDAVLTTMACGLDPDNCTLFIQSHVPEHTELTWLFNTITPMGSLFRMTQFKDKARNSLQRALDKKQGGARKSAFHELWNTGQKTVDICEELKTALDTCTPEAEARAEDASDRVMRINDLMGIALQHLQVGLGVADASCGLFDYPVLQAADILLYKASLVPVGEDQEQHLELCREIAQRFNRRFKPIFPMANRIRGEATRIIGLDGTQKMSKSLNNYIGVLDDRETILRRLKPAFTDPSRLKRNDPGHPEICNVFSLHRNFSPPDTCARIESECRTGRIGCFDCKTELADTMAASLAPIRERAAFLQNHPNHVHEAIVSGRDRARQMARETIHEVRDAMGIGADILNML